MSPPNDITNKEIIRVKEFKKILIDISQARGAPVPLKSFIKQIINKIDKILLNEKYRNRLNTINLLIELSKKLIAILQWFCN